VRIELAGAALIGVATDPALLRAAGELVQARDDNFAARVELAGVDAWLKSEPVSERARLRLSLRRWLGAGAPCVSELRNLRWLREHDFRAPEPLAAGVLVRGGLVLRQLLATRWLGAHRTLDVVLRDAPAVELRTRVLELARDLAHMHALDFVHRDLFPRNLLVDSAPRVIFSDCRRGGRARLRRAAEYDLGCLMLEGASLLERAEQLELFTCYFAERAARGAPANPAASLAAANRCREALLAQIARVPQRWRSPSPPLSSWPWRELADALSRATC
jgi:tRNA A-37 threonylcarbamoyl transferase component Bud32